MSRPNPLVIAQTLFASGEFEECCRFLYDYCVQQGALVREIVELNGGTMELNRTSLYGRLSGLEAYGYYVREEADKVIINTVPPDDTVSNEVPDGVLQ